MRQMLGSVDRSVVFSLIEAGWRRRPQAVVEQVINCAAGQSAATTLE